MRRAFLRVAALGAVALTAVVPAAATSIVRTDLGKMAAANALIVKGEVVDVYSHWNEDGNFIVSDVTVVVDETMKGQHQREIVFTALGGTVGDLSTVIVGGPEIEVGKRYVVFLNREDIPGRAAALTVRDLSMGIFDVVDAPSGEWALNQSLRHPLLPDDSGSIEPPGGFSGMSVDNLRRAVRDAVRAR
jgi:hypothetical protein